MEGISIGYVVALAAADAVNPCAFAVLTIILVSIIAHNPDNKSRVLWSGLAFASAILIMYPIYGLIIIKSFQMVNDTVTWVRPFMYKGLGGLAIILGLFQIKDFFSYKAGGFST